MSTPIPTPGALPESWRVCLPVFEGPLDLLLHLVKVSEVEISDIPVARICDQFHEYLGLMEDLDLDVAGEYVYEASLLIQLKSKMLLPIPRDEEGRPLEDPRQELVDRLLEYRRIKEAAESLAEVHSLRRGVWGRPPTDPKEIVDDAESVREIDLGDVSLFDLLGALQSVLDRYDREHPPPLHLQQETFSVRDQVGRMLHRMKGGRALRLLDDLRALSCRAEAVAAFLAVLEMAKMELIRLEQAVDGSIQMLRTARDFHDAELEAIEG